MKHDLNPDPSRLKGDERPVEYVSWFDAMEFCARLSQLTERDYTLPTEAQWEYACRAGTTTPFHCGETLTQEMANIENFDFGETVPVGCYSPNAFGLSDMHGNVRELCLDHWHDSYDGAPTDGSAWTGKSEFNVLRGGSWSSKPHCCRSAYRHWINPDFRSSNLGFRVACGGSGGTS